MDSPDTGPPPPDQDFVAFAQEVFQVARSGDAPTLDRLLQKGLPPNMSNHKGDTLLMLAAYHGHVEATRVLLEAGAEPDRFNDMAQTPLAAVAFKGYLPIVELLLAHGAQPGYAPPGGKTPLMFAAMFNRLEIVKVLLARGIDMHAKSSEGLSALDLARSMGAVDTAAHLESSGSTGGPDQ
jgi:ankyrin repeat protein